MLGPSPSISWSLNATILPKSTSSCEGQLECLCLPFQRRHSFVKGTLGYLLFVRTYTPEINAAYQCWISSGVAAAATVTRRHIHQMNDGYVSQSKRTFYQNSYVSSIGGGFYKMVLNIDFIPWAHWHVQKKKWTQTRTRRRKPPIHSSDRITGPTDHDFSTPIANCVVPCCRICLCFVEICSTRPAPLSAAFGRWWLSEQAAQLCVRWVVQHLEPCAIWYHIWYHKIMILTMIS